MLAVRCDVADEDQVASAVAQTVDTFGSLDAAYNNAGIQSPMICPGTIETPMVTQMIESGDLDQDEAAANQPIGRLGTAEEMAAVVLWLCSPGSSFVIGTALLVDGGYTAI